jgi:hypothetical protein
MQLSERTCLVSLLTAPGKTTYSTAFITIGRLDLDTGSRNSFAETEQREKRLECSKVSVPVFRIRIRVDPHNRTYINTLR